MTLEHWIIISIASLGLAGAFFGICAAIAMWITPEDDGGFWP